MKLDVLDGMETVKLCTGYQYRNSVLKEFPASLKVLAECTPIYEEMPGWRKETTQAKQFSDLPVQAQDYLKRISELSGAPISMVSVGWRRDETILVNDIW
jgi:adenylosuccinate synthase